MNFQSPQGYVNGQKYYAPVPFNPGSYGGPNAPGYLNFGSDYNPVTNPNDYLYSGKYTVPNSPVVYGSAPTNSLASYGLSGDVFLNGIDYTQGASYANQAANGIGTPKGQSYGVNDGAPGFGGSPAGVTPYTQYTEPGYRAPQYSQAAPTGTQSYGPLGQPQAGYQPGGQATFLYGNNGSAGSLGGVFSNNTPGQSSAFYQNEPASLTQGDTNPTLGQFTSYNPLGGQQNTQASNPGLQALQQSRSQP